MQFQRITGWKNTSAWSTSLPRHNHCDQCYVSIRSYLDKSFPQILWENTSRFLSFGSKPAVAVPPQVAEQEAEVERDRVDRDRWYAACHANLDIQSPADRPNLIAWPEPCQHGDRGSVEDGHEQRIRGKRLRKS